MKTRSGTRLLVALWCAIGSATGADAIKLPDDAEAAWAQIQKSAKPPLPPAEWNQKTPTPAEYEAYRRGLGAAAAAGADLAKEFSQRFPDHAKTTEAAGLRKKLLQAAVQYGDQDRTKELAELPTPEPKAQAASKPSANESTGDKPDANGDPAVENEPPSDAFTAKFRRVIEHAKAQGSQGGMTAVLKDFEKGLRGLQKEFPKEPQVYAGLMEVAQNLGGDEGLVIAREIVASPVATALHPAAQRLVAQLSRVGNSVDLKFTGTDGKPFDLASLKGKVVLVDFWATWCGPCRAEIPNVVSAYEKLHPKGFEIVGISFDQDRDALDGYVKKYKMPWVQYFDGQGWGNKFGQEFGITGIPSMWLIDKQGKVRDLNARGGLETKVEKLLAEP